MKHIYLFFVAVFAIQTAQSQIVNIPDANFKNALVNTNCTSLNGSYPPTEDVDTNNDGEIQVSEAEATMYLRMSNQNISSIEGIQSFVNASELDFDNNQISVTDLSNLNNLSYIILDSNQFTSTDDIIFTANSNSCCFGLSIADNQLTNINANNLPLNLSDLDCSNNQLTSLDVSAFNIYEFRCSDNPNLTSLQLSSFTGDLVLNNIGISDLDVSELTNLYTLSCNNNNNLVSVKLGHGSEYGFSIQNNPVLETINFKNGYANNSGPSGSNQNYSICNNPNLTFVCADEFEIDNSSYTVNEGGNIFEVPIYGIQQFIDDCGYANVIVSSYCDDFVAGGTFYTIQGASSLDANTNGCDVGDANIGNFKYNITNGFNAGDFTADEFGNYSYLVQEGTHTITPILENPDYFTVSPSSFTVNFPTDASPFSQNFCITPNGTHIDLEVTLIPLNQARPGFDSDYKLVYKNKGTTTLSGTIGLTFNEDVMDLVSANPIADTQSTDLLNWNYSSLPPLESRELLITMNLNTPTDTPPLNGDDVLGFTATVNSITGDETPDNNTFTLNQTVVNSFDPNDKTCLEGNTITPDLIGEYVNYLIRFENTGTANAINIVVKDVIDTSKFDLPSLFVTDVSHNLTTSITNIDEVRFSFENINLPFDDANNDGYIAFKIKTLPTLVVGDTFENDAQIFFDYNFPIDTNIAQTSIENTLSNNDFELSGLEIYPNPIQDKLYINGIDSIQSVTIYDLSGRLINQVSYIGNHSNIEISTEKLSQGTYFVKVKTDSGEFAKKVVKE